jgi:large subunit ribosomal protein L33
MFPDFAGRKSFCLRAQGFGKRAQAGNTKDNIQFRLIKLACGTCKRRNYTSMKNKKNDPDRLNINKYCKWCRQHLEHKETKR